MKRLSLVCVVVCLVLSASAALARGGTGAHMSMGGALGTSAAAPGTNSLGTALPTDVGAGHPMKGPLLGTSPAIDQENARLSKMLEGSVCRGC